MKIILHPVATFSEQIDILPSVDENIFTYRGKTYDFSELQNGEKMKLPIPFIQPVVRINGNLQIEVEYKYSLTKAAPVQSSNWDDFTFDINFGQCPCPIKFI